MKRHPGLQGLSSDHHQALRIARMLRSDTPEGLRGELPSAADDAVPWLQERFEVDLWPHFLLEERELVPLGVCGAPALREHTARVQRDHLALRDGFHGLAADTFTSQRDALADLLAEHVRFEERRFFPALEQMLSNAELDALVRRVRPKPEALTVGFHTDEDGVWVAELDCGHTRHVRHRPPFQEASWVQTEAGRHEKLGTPVPCPLCRMPRRPRCLEAYKETPEYDADSLPAGLRRTHQLKPGTWGEIEVLSGRVHYVLEDEADLTVTLRPGVPGIVAPTRPHHVRPSHDARLRIRFLRPHLR